MIEAKILLDSVGVDGCAPRLTTWLLTFSRFTLAEFNTHRMISRNAASSRAIPVKKRIDMVVSDPVIPVEWSLDMPGMQSNSVADPETESLALKEWLAARDEMVIRAQNLIKLGIHKQIVNRLLEPFAYVTVLATAVQSGWENFFALRAEFNADPNIRALAYKMLELYQTTKPQILQRGELHIPFGDKMLEGLTPPERTKVAVARTARLSYNNFDGSSDIQKDFALHDQLSERGHWSAFEHIAQVPLERFGSDAKDLLNCQLLHSKFNSGNLTGWNQLRKGYPNECRKDPRVPKL